MSHVTDDLCLLVHTVAAFHGLTHHMWLVAAISDSADTAFPSLQKALSDSASLEHEI